MSSTAAAPQALTTPFVAPSSCIDQFKTTSFVSSFYWNNYSTTTVTVLASGPADSRFSACQPPGWDQAAQFAFSPAVCPGAWTAYDLEGTLSGVGTPVTHEKLVTTAYCCSSGFSLSSISGSPIKGIASTACFKDIVVQATTAAATTVSPSNIQARTETQLFPDGFSVHNAWHISWEPSDASALSPSPPQLPCTTAGLSSWVPGTTPDPSLLAGVCGSTNDGASHMSSGDTKLFWFMAVGLPIILSALIALCIGVWCHRRRKGGRQRLESTATGHTEAIGLTNTKSR